MFVLMSVYKVRAFLIDVYAYKVSEAYEERMDLKLLCSYMGHLESQKPGYFSEQEYMLANLHDGVMTYVEILE